MVINQVVNWNCTYAIIVTFVISVTTKVGKNVRKKNYKHFGKQEEGKTTPLFFVLSVFSIN
jgi:hypothetical protein